MASIIIFFSYSHLLPRRHPTIPNSRILRTVGKSRAMINFKCLTQVDSPLIALSLKQTLTLGPNSVRFKGSWLYWIKTNLGKVIISCSSSSSQLTSSWNSLMSSFACTRIWLTIFFSYNSRPRRIQSSHQNQRTSHPALVERPRRRSSLFLSTIISILVQSCATPLPCGPSYTLLSFCNLETFVCFILLQFIIFHKTYLKYLGYHISFSLNFARIKFSDFCDMGKIAKRKTHDI